jgi:limonene 1,2-monooxygenase
LERDLELIQHLDSLGFDEAWIGEHHLGGYEIIASPEVFITTAAECTRHIRLGTGVSSVPYHHPFSSHRNDQRPNGLASVWRARGLTACHPY